MDRPHLWHSLSCFCNLALSASWVQSAFSPHPCISKILLILQGLFFNELHSTSLHTWVTHLTFITPYYSYLKKPLICPTNSLSTERIHNLGVFKLYISFFHSVLYVRIKIWNINWSTSPPSSVHKHTFPCPLPLVLSSSQTARVFPSLPQGERRRQVSDVCLIDIWSSWCDNSLISQRFGFGIAFQEPKENKTRN